MNNEMNSPLEHPQSANSSVTGLKRRTVTLSMLGLMLALNLAVESDDPAQGYDALVLLQEQYAAGTRQTTQRLEALGVQIRHVFPPSAFICSLPFELEVEVLAHLAVVAIHRTEVELTDATRSDEALSAGIRAWNRLVAPPTLLAADARATTEPLAGDAFHPPPDDPGRALHGMADDQGFAPAPSPTQTSEYLIGKVAVGIVLPESSGSAEDWSAARQDQVIAEITAGCDWWVKQSGGKARLGFYYDVRRSVKTLGYAGSSRFTVCRQYADALRTRLGCEWGFVIFVADSLNDADGKFSDGSYFAYAYLNGPFMVMTYDNNGYGIGAMDVVMAHEMEHVFGALDEYAGASSCSAQGGYLCVPNGNYSGCAPPGDGTCVMRGGFRYGLCNFSRGQIGWRDSDEEGILDPVDTTVVLSLHIQGGEVAYRASGTATDVPFPPGCYHQPCTINTVTRVEYRVDGGARLPATPSDRAFNSPDEPFEFTVEDPRGGLRQIKVRAVNSMGNGITTSDRPVPAVVYVDWRCTCAAPTGTPACPFCTVPDGLKAVVECGTVRIAAGHYPGPMLLAKCGRIESLGGRVLLGGTGRPGPISDDVVRPETGEVAEGGAGRLPAPTVINQPRLRSDGAFALTLQVVPGDRYEVYASTDLSAWSLLQAFTAEGTVYELVEPDPAAFPARFYKVVAP